VTFVPARRDARAELVRLADALSEDASLTGDADLVAESADDSGVAAEMKAAFERVVAGVGKERLAQARRELHVAKGKIGLFSERKPNRVPTPPVDALTQAARNGREQSARDIASANEDIEELRALNEDEDESR
jgi:hypothetical protein